MSPNPGTVAATNPHAEISVPPGADFPDDSQPDGYRIVYGSRREVCGAIGGAPACISFMGSLSVATAAIRRSRTAGRHPSMVTPTNFHCGNQ